MSLNNWIKNRMSRVYERYSAKLIEMAEKEKIQVKQKARKPGFDCQFCGKRFEGVFIATKKTCYDCKVNRRRKAALVSVARKKAKNLKIRVGN